MGVAGRLLIEPGTNHYYAAGLALGALVWDTLAGRGRLPWMTLWTVALFEVPNHIAFLPRHVVGLLRVAACVGAIMFVVARPVRRESFADMKFLDAMAKKPVM
jgi:hypothetical protein